MKLTTELLNMLGGNTRRHYKTAILTTVMVSPYHEGNTISLFISHAMLTYPIQDSLICSARLA